MYSFTRENLLLLHTVVVPKQPSSSYSFYFFFLPPLFLRATPPKPLNQLLWNFLHLLHVYPVYGKWYFFKRFRIWIRIRIQISIFSLNPFISKTIHSIWKILFASESSYLDLQTFFFMLRVLSNPSGSDLGFKSGSVDYPFLIKRFLDGFAWLLYQMKAYSKCNNFYYKH